MEDFLKFIKSWFETPKEERVVKYSDPRQNLRKPDWLVQTKADLDRHEGFREFAYPDPLSKLGRKYAARRFNWGFERGDLLLVKYGEKEEDGRPWTYGYGFTHGVTPASRINKQMAQQLLEPILLEHVRVLDRLIPSWRTMPTAIQTVLANMAFNMGNRLEQFTNTLNIIKAGRYAEAGDRLTTSLWYKQVGVRAKELVERLKTGKIQDEYKVI